MYRFISITAAVCLSVGMLSACASDGKGPDFSIVTELFTGGEESEEIACETPWAEYAALACPLVGDWKETQICTYSAQIAHATQMITCIATGVLKE